MNQESELGPVVEGAVLELRCPLWQKLFVAPLVLLICGLGVISSIGALWPHLLEHRPDKLPDVGTRVGLLFGGPFMFGIGLYMAQVWFYRLSVDAYRLTESLGWKETHVFWSDVASYSMEPNTNQHRHPRDIEPVMRDAGGAILFRPAGPVVVSDEATIQRRREFWSFVQLHLEGKETLYTPPLPIPSIYEGKSTAWKIKRLALLGLCILAFVGLWSAAMMWSIAQPALPR